MKKLVKTLAVSLSLLASAGAVFASPKPLTNRPPSGSNPPIEDSLDKPEGESEPKPGKGTSTPPKRTPPREPERPPRNQPPPPQPKRPPRIHITPPVEDPLPPPPPGSSMAVTSSHLEGYLHVVTVNGKRRLRVNAPNGKSYTLLTIEPETRIQYDSEGNEYEVETSNFPDVDNLLEYRDRYIKLNGSLNFQTGFFKVYEIQTW